jgi:hypothetical protein
MTLIPLSFCAFNVSCLFNGLVYYNQWDRFRWWQLMYVMFGVIVTIFGVLLLSWQSSNNKSNVTTDEIGTLSLSDNEPSGEEGESVIACTIASSEEDEEDNYNPKSNLLVKKNHDIGSIRLT